MAEGPVREIMVRLKPVIWMGNEEIEVDGVAIYGRLGAQEGVEARHLDAEVTGLLRDLGDLIAGRTGNFLSPEDAKEDSEIIRKGISAAVQRAYTRLDEWFVVSDA